MNFLRKVWTINICKPWIVKVIWKPLLFISKNCHTIVHRFHKSKVGVWQIWNSLRKECSSVFPRNHGFVDYYCAISSGFLISFCSLVSCKWGGLRCAAAKPWSSPSFGTFFYSCEGISEHIHGPIPNILLQSN